MAGMEGGVGGPRLKWGRYWLVMLGMIAATIVAVSAGVHFGWIR